MILYGGSMLLIAQPKSASTSITHTLAFIGKIKFRLGIPRKKGSKNCTGYKELQRYHNNMVKRSEVFIEQTSKGKKTLFKEHLLPTDEHLKILSKCVKNNKLVVLLRYPEHSLDSYLRQFKKNGRKDCNEQELLNNLRDFHDRYMYWASNKRNVIIVYYKDLIKNYNVTMFRILRHYKIGKKRLIPMMKIKNTGVGRKRLCS
jgi:hypothetical protein